MRTSADKISAGHILIFLLLAFAGIGASQASTPEKKDVRVLIDISGSMRQNDPENLRRPALRMLAEEFGAATVDLHGALTRGEDRCDHFLDNVHLTVAGLDRAASSIAEPFLARGLH